MKEEPNPSNGACSALGWIPVTDIKSLPKKDEWVQVFEDDNDNKQDAFIGNLCGTFRHRVVPAKLLYVDTEGNADWYLCYIGGGPLRHTRNVTHWRPLSDPPNKDSQDKMLCPECGSTCYRDEVDVEVGVIKGPWGCPCGWSEDERYSHNPDARYDSRGGFTPNNV